MRRAQINAPTPVSAPVVPLEEAIRRHHPYELPEIVAVPITYGLPAYLDWIAAETDADA